MAETLTIEQVKTIEKRIDDCNICGGDYCGECLIDMEILEINKQKLEGSGTLGWKFGHFARIPFGAESEA